MTKIKGNRDGRGGRNETYDVGNRRKIPRRQLVKEIEQGQYPHGHVCERGGQKYARDNPDRSKQDNVNRGRD